MPPNNESTRDVYYYDSSSSNRRHYNPQFKYCIKAESLEMGVYRQLDTFVSEKMYADYVYFIVDYQKRNIRVEFEVRGQLRKYLYSLEIEFKDLDGEFYVERQGSHQSFTIANKFPARFWLYDDVKQSMKRMTRIQTLKGEGPLQPHMPDYSEQLGKWVVYRITFDINKIEDQRGFREMFDKAREYNLVPTNFSEPLKIVKGIILNEHKYVNRSMLHFDVLYMVECNISFNYLHDYNLSREFFFLLHKLPVQTAVHILEKIYENKKRIYDPLTYLHSEAKRLKNVTIKSIDVPDYCAMMRKIIVTSTTMYMLPPTMETSNRVIRNFKSKKDNFLRVHFSDEASNKIGASSGNHNENYNDALYNRIYYTLDHGIKIGDTHYEFLAFSSSQLRDHSCWFFASTDDLTANDIRNWMGNFSDVKTVAKYAARMGQCFSSTRAIQHLPVDDINEIPDIKRNGYVFSDGIGQISHSLARKISAKLELKYIPSAFQFRMAGYKGMLCQESSLQGNQVKVRESQRKFKSDHNELEIIRCSAYIPAYLNRQAITLLSVLGIPDNVFIKMKDEQVNELNTILESDSKAISQLQQNVDEYGISKSLAELVKAGFLQRKDPYLVNLISLFRITMLRDIKKKAKIRVNKGAFLLGVLDETKTLKEDEVYCCVSDPCNPSSRKWITGTCIVYRNPCFHPGDIRIVKAVKREALYDLVDVLVFPQVGERDIPNQCSGGDLDGDDFTIIYDEDMIPKQLHDPMNYESQKPEIVDQVTMSNIKVFFVNYVFSDQLGKIANAHLARADMYQDGAKHESCISLAHLHSDAVDFPKTGIPAKFPSGLRVKSFPDFMEKPDKPYYESKKVLGVLYRSIKEEEYEPYTHSSFDTRLRVAGFEEYLENARMLKRAYDSDIKGLMNQFGIMTEFEVTSGYIINTLPIDKKKPRDVVKSVMDAMVPIKKQYRRLFDEQFYDRIDKRTVIISPDAYGKKESKAFAWYYVTYHPSEQTERKDENMISFPWIVGDILCEIALKNNVTTLRNNVTTLRNNVKINGKNLPIRTSIQQTANYNNASSCNQESDDINDDMARLRRMISTK